MPEPQALRHPLPPPLPNDKQGFLAARKVKMGRTLNDEVEAIYIILAENERFKRLIYATYDEQALEGSLAADNHEAARMIRDTAPEGSVIKTEKLATISKALGVVARRYGFSRKERRNMLGGEYVPPDLQNGE